MPRINVDAIAPICELNIAKLSQKLTNQEGV